MFSFMATHSPRVEAVIPGARSRLSWAQTVLPPTPSQLGSRDRRDPFSAAVHLPNPPLAAAGLPRWHSAKASACQFRRRMRRGFDPWVRKIPGEGNGNLLQYSCVENPMDRRAWWATVLGVAESQAQLSN